MQIKYINTSNEEQYCDINKYPDKCPICNDGITAKFLGAHELHRNGGDRYLSIVFKCPKSDCKGIFVGYYKTYRKFEENFSLQSTALPYYVKHSDFPKTIKTVSIKFRKIYVQSEYAEENGLNEICGCGYRRALEFLIKDYLISLGESCEDISKKYLKDCIELIKDDNIQATAKRAAWLGNDETHYTRKWPELDLKNLKDLIRLTVNWIDSAEMTKKYKEEMPDK